jgi:hypothetical protein
MDQLEPAVVPVLRLLVTLVQQLGLPIRPRYLNMAQGRRHPACKDMTVNAKSEQNHKKQTCFLQDVLDFNGLKELLALC